MSFTFDGVAYTGRAGDTLAGALLANGVTVFGRSFKYHRKRGIVGAGAEEPNALVTVDRGAGRRTPNLLATQVELYDGLIAISQNRWPSLAFDLGAMTNQLGFLFPAGFYNKTFMWPRSLWERLYEPAIRQMAGLGEPPREADPDHYAATYAHCELLIVGAGPAGIDAALEAANTGRRVILIDDQAEIGGGALSDAALWPWLDRSVTALGEAMNVRILTRTTAFGHYHDNFIGAVSRLADHLPGNPAGPREKLWRIRAGEVVLAQGAIERPLVFAGNDTPGVMLASAARTWLNRYGVAVGKSPLVMASHDSGWQVAFDYAEAGATPAAIVDCRADVARELKARAEALGIPIVLSAAVTAVSGGSAVRAARVTDFVEHDVAGISRTIACDAILMAGGWTPSIHLWSHSKGTIRWRDDLGAYVPDKTHEACRAVGGCAGDLKLGSGTTMAALPTDRDPARIKAFVDFQNDVCARDIRLAVREGFRSIEHVKRYTTNGMATDQGKTSNINGMEIAAELLKKTAPDMGLTTFRPPYTPQTFAALAGHHKGPLFQPVRKTPIDAWAAGHGAVFENAAQWRRARYFPQAGEDMAAATRRECRATRGAVGIFDASTLGKIEVVGPDAAEFLNRMYTNPWKGLAPGRCRYGLLLRDDGFIMDDGVSARLEPNRFHLTTTTGGAARVLNMMEDYLQTEWPDLKVWLTSTTEQWAVIALNGPQARAVLAALVDDIDLSPEAFPHMAIREGHIAGVPTRLFRVSFTGELGFEVNVPAAYGLAVWEAMMAAGAAHEITPYGTETMHILRAEKGYIIVGQDTDGTLTPDDAGLGWAVGAKKPDFVGKRGLARPDLAAAGRRQFVGLLTEDPTHILEEGAQIVFDPAQAIPMTMVGHVTSSYWSEALGRSIALAVVAGGRRRMGEGVHIPMPGATHRAVICDPVFYDSQGARLDG
ncbi:MAG: 2Fe-2S iron-sulfur cluster-binding protein [Sphingomonadaceae bacterium]